MQLLTQTCWLCPAGWSVKQHLLTSYLHSLASICIAQLFKYKRLDGGLKGIKLLAQSPEVCKLLASTGALGRLSRYISPPF